MISLRLTLASALLLSIAANAESNSPAASYQLKNRSAFSLQDVSRPPFWPIGWVKRSATSGQPTAEPVKASMVTESNFNVTSILLGNPSLAVINGRSYMEGEFVKLPKSIAGVRVRVQRIVDGAVELQAGEQSIAARLRRPEMALKESREELLNLERE